TLLSQVREANLPVDPRDAAALSCPVLLVGGAQSPAKYGTRQDRLQQLLPHARRARIALAAHGMNLANPRSLNRTILEFIAAASAAPAQSAGARPAAACGGRAGGISASCARTCHARPTWPWAT